MVAQDGPSIYPLLESSGNQRVLTDWLAAHTTYSVAATERPVSEGDFDVCIADHPAFEAHTEALRTAKTSAQPVLLPVLLLLPDDRTDIIDADQGEIDAVRSTSPSATIGIEDSLPDVDVIANSMLTSVFRNLLTNAIQHSDRSVPEITVSATQRDETVRVQVADNGPGIPDGQKDDVFGKGEKGLESAGSGVGLYLVRSLVESYGGGVWIEDNEPTGAVFVIDLRYADDADPA